MCYMFFLNSDYTQSQRLSNFFFLSRQCKDVHTPWTHIHKTHAGLLLIKCFGSIKHASISRVRYITRGTHEKCGALGVKIASFDNITRESQVRLQTHQTGVTRWQITYVCQACQNCHAIAGHSQKAKCAVSWIFLCPALADWGRQRSSEKLPSTLSMI